MALDLFNELFNDLDDVEVVDEDDVSPSTDSDENSTPSSTDLDLLLSSSTKYKDNSEKGTLSSQLPLRLTSTYARQRPHSLERQVSLSPPPSRSRTSTAPLTDLDILLSFATEQTKQTRVSSSSPPRTPKHTRHLSHSPVRHVSSSPASTSRTHAASADSGIFVRTYNLPSRSDLVSLQTITILEHLKATVFVNGGNNNLVQINTRVNPSPQLILHGYVDQHLQMDEIVKRFHRLVKFVVELQTEYKKAMLNSIQALVDRMNKVRVEGKMKRIWNTFIAYVKDLLKEEADKLYTLYKDHIETLCRSLVVTGCIKMNVSYETELNDFNDSFTNKHSIDNSYEDIKQQAFKVFNADMKGKWKPEDVPDDKIASKVLGKQSY
ncbi:unnamed protein product [Rotaria socialis]|uniref:Uncharacterized protein n=1 Tax=Rotaria socialis TaxID=392032 RepID=A0A817YS71_9BILA|nr:unnamed protein product [Rotaria socialis]CAF4563298.1 unnamed protein product [Rotaria socialis]